MFLPGTTSEGLTADCGSIEEEELYQFVTFLLKLINESLTHVGKFIVQ